MESLGKLHNQMNGTRNISLLVEYDGTDYHGWQCQPNGITVQEVLTARVERIVDHAVKLYAAGRTDAGVHAMGQVVNFHTVRGIGLTNLARGLNSMLPRDIRVKAAGEVDHEFHARYSAKSKLYLYCIYNGVQPSPFNFRYVWHVSHRLDSALMDDAARSLVGSHDFSSFKKKEEVYGSYEREVLLSRVRRKGPFIYTFLEATGFMRYMVRNIVGTLVLIGSGRMERDSLPAILAAKDRDRAGPTAPPQGLFLRRVRY